MPNTVVVVEDDPILRSDAVAMIEELGLNIIEMETAEDALAYLVEQSGNVSVVFTDVQLAGEMNGLELARWITASWPGVLVMVTSGRVTPPSDLPAKVKFMPKPWLALDVLTAVTDKT